MNITEINQLTIAAQKYRNNGKFDKELQCLEALYPDDKENIHKEIIEYRKRVKGMINTQNASQIIECLKQSYFIGGKDYFTDFMQYIEWDRPNDQKFWQPRAKQLAEVAQALQDLEDNKLDELFLSMPPRVGKTTIVMFFTLWIILRNDERSNLYASYSDTVAKVFFNGLMEILKDPNTYKWNDVFPSSKIASTDAKDLLLNVGRKKRYASFTARSLYGTLNGACDCNGYEIADDLHSGIEEAMNKDRLNSAWMKVDNNFLPRAKMGTKHLWIGTRWSMVDCQARRLEMLQNDPKFDSVRWKAVNVPALDENEESNFNYLCGVGFDTEYYQQRRASFERNNDMASWLAQYQGEPIERDGAVFSPDDFNYYNGVLPEAEPDRIFMAVDPAWGGGDFVASPIIFQYDDKLFIHDVIYDNGDKKVTQPLIVHAAKKYGVQAISIEATKMTKGYADGIDEELKAQGYHLNIMTSTSHFTGNGKEQRIFDKAPDIREHMIFLESGKRSKAYELFMQNVFSFSINGKNKNDDAPDSLAMAINMAFFALTNTATITKRKW